LTEKSIRVEAINPSQFFGTENKNLKFLQKRFPTLKLTSRGDEIKASGPEDQIIVFEEKLGELIQQLLNNPSISDGEVETILEGEPHPKTEKEQDLTKDVLVYGSRGRIIIKRKEVKKIILARPAVEAGESLGFLPGDLKEKIDPYLQPLYNSLLDMMPSDKYMKYIENGTVEVVPLAFMRGRTLDNCFVILDEAQNATETQLKMFLTRMGPNAKMIVTGDMSQVDLPRNQTSGLQGAIRMLSRIKGIAIVELDVMDVVRHKLVKEIIKAYDRKKED